MSVKDTVLRAINVLPPAAAYSAVKFINSRRRAGMYGEVRNRVIAWHENAGRPTKVMKGPFAGMQLTFRPITGFYALPAMCRYLGTYEMEIDPFVQAICDLKPDVLVDIGAADGFYAIGFARKLPETRIIGFEMNSASRYVLGINARLNGNPGQLDLRRRCDPAKLQAALSGSRKPAVLCDVDGYEQVIIDPAAVPDLKRATILVEVHEQLAPGISQTLLDRFSGTHEITIVRERPRTAADKPSGCTLNDEDFIAATKEYRDAVPGVWYFMRPR